MDSTNKHILFARLTALDTMIEVFETPSDVKPGTPVYYEYERFRAHMKTYLRQRREFLEEQYG